MITLKEALIIHALTIDKFGGSYGVIDMNLLKSAIERPNATFDGKVLYPNAVDKAAAIIESVQIEHYWKSSQPLSDS